MKRIEREAVERKRPRGGGGDEDKEETNKEERV